MMFRQLFFGFALCVATLIVTASPLTSALTYQGELLMDGVPAQGSYDFEFRLFTSAQGGFLSGPTLNRDGVPVADGLFSTELDFGPTQFAGDDLWLEVRVRPAGLGAFETLSPRSHVTAAPYAWSAAYALTNSVNSLSVMDGGVTRQDIADGAIDDTKITDGAIGSTKVRADQVQLRVQNACPIGSAIRSIGLSGDVTCENDDAGLGTVTAITAGDGLLGGTINVSGTIAIAQDGVNQFMLQANSVGSSELQDAAVSQSKLQSGVVGSAQIIDTEVQRRVTGSCAGNQAVQSIGINGTVTCGNVGAGWSLSGNAGTNPATQYLGTSDAQSLVLATRGSPALRLIPSTILFGGRPITQSLIGGSSDNVIRSGARGATIGGGGAPSGLTDPEFSLEAPNQVASHYTVIGGGLSNEAGDDAQDMFLSAFATVSGGHRNRALGYASSIGGGFDNRATNQGSTVAGGQSNFASAADAAIGGGTTNLASGAGSVIAGGNSGVARGADSAIGGGTNNTVSGTESVVIGGASNTASNQGATVSGGSQNCAGGAHSWAGGRFAKVRPGSTSGDAGMGCSGVGSSGDADGDESTFVWSDTSTSTNMVSSGPDQFLVRANGGAVFTGSGSVNSPSGNRLRVDGTLRVDTLGSAGATALCYNASNQIAACSSSARYKKAIADLPAELGLAAAMRLRPVSFRWRDSDAADVGFVAEEVAALDARLVVRNKHGEIEGVKYDRLSAVLARAVQDLAAARSLDAERLQTLEQALAKQAALLTRLERQLNAAEATP